MVGHSGSLTKWTLSMYVPVEEDSLSGGSRLNIPHVIPSLPRPTVEPVEGLPS